MGASDTIIFSIIVTILIVTSLVSGALSKEISGSGGQANVQGELDNAQNTLSTSTSSTSVWTIFQVLGGILAFSFGLIPAWLDYSFIVLRLIAYIILIKWARGVSQ